MFGRSALLAVTNSGPPLWTPTQISTALWLDASDSSSVTTVSGAVSQWIDKSGNARHATQATAGYRPAYVTGGLNGLNVISFNGSSNLLSLAANLSLGTQHSIYVVVKNNNTITSPSSTWTNRSIFSCASPATWLFTGNGASNFFGERIYYGNLSLAASGAGYIKADADIPSQTFLVGLRWTSSGPTFSGRFNGANDFATVLNGGSATSFVGALRDIGGETATTGVWDGLFCEVIVVPTYQSLSDTQIVEGYLAWKWGFQGSLPAGHTYKSSAPSLNP